MSPGTAANVEDARTLAQPESVDEKIDFLLGALGERVAEVGLSHVRSETFEPVAIGANLATPHVYFASAHVTPHAAFTSRGTASVAAPRMTPRTISSTDFFSAVGDSTRTSS